MRRHLKTQVLRAPECTAPALDESAKDPASGPPPETADNAPDPSWVLGVMEGALSRLVVARGHQDRGATAQTSHHIRSAMALIATLQETLAADGEAAGRLDALYDYMLGQLYQARSRNDSRALEEVTRLLTTIKSYEEWLILHGDVQ